MSESQEVKKGISRRDFLKTSSLVAVAVQLAGIGGNALAAGKGLPKAASCPTLCHTPSRNAYPVANKRLSTF